MLKRKMSERLLAWKNNETRKVLILLGARQTGKTYIVREFARENYDDFIEINFYDEKDNAEFLSQAASAEDFVSRLSLIKGSSISLGSLLFLDEIQELGKEAVTLSKFLLDDGRFDLILSGSLLGTTIEGATSFPVGYAHIERMYPLDFEEYCWALGVPDAIIDQIKTAYRNKAPLEESLHKRMIQIFRQYIVIGGMPEAVQKFLDSNRNAGEARAVDLDIVEQYKFDITKYAGSHKFNILTIFENIPNQLTKANKRFALMTVKKGAVYERLKDDFVWLTKAGVALPTYIVNEPKYPLKSTKVKEKFKLYSSDCGILLSQYPQVAAMRVVSGEGDANYGAVYENVIAQEITAAGFPLYYYNNNRKGEVDFLIETAQGTVLPIEVKSGKDYKLHSALKNMMETESYGIGCAYVLSEFNTSMGEKAGKPIYYLPLYMSMCLVEERGNQLSDFFFDEIDFDDLV